MQGFRKLSDVFSFAKRNEIVTHNPCETAAVCKSDNQNERYLTLDEVKRFGQALKELEAEGTNAKALNIIRLWTLTGCRRSEIASLEWNEVDFEEACLRLGDTKSGKSVRPLGMAALAVLRSIEPTEGSDYVFPAEIGRSYFHSYRTPWKHIIERADLIDVTPHTLRHTMGSTAISSGEAMAFTGAILGHVNPRSTAIYAHVQHDPAREAANRVTERIAVALAGIGNRNTQEAEPDIDKALLCRIANVLAKGGTDAERLRTVFNVLVA
jgi:integrase